MTKEEKDYLLPKEPVKFIVCDNCGDDIFVGEEYFDIDGAHICDECASSTTVREFYLHCKKVARKEKDYGI